MARKSEIDVEAAAGEVAAQPDVWKRVKIRHYKVFTSQGRQLDGHFVVLPAAEADELVSKGHAKHAPIE